MKHKPRFPDSPNGSESSINKWQNKPSHLQQIPAWGMRFEATTNSMFCGTYVPRKSKRHGDLTGKNGTCRKQNIGLHGNIRSPGPVEVQRSKRCRTLFQDGIDDMICTPIPYIHNMCVCVVPRVQLLIGISTVAASKKTLLNH